LLLRVSNIVIFVELDAIFAGDLIPWTMAQQFQDDNFPQLSGARIVRYENKNTGQE
jgi:hypothetical protein